jgi:hypothetical protein
MDRRRVAVIALMVWTLASASTARAQTAPSPEGWVVLPVDEYRTLRARALPTPLPPTAPPLDASLSRIDYDLRLDGDIAAGRAQLTIDVLREGWTRVPIPQGLFVREAALDGRRVPLIEGTPPQVLLSRAGRALLTLDVVMPTSTAGGAETLSLPPSAAPIVRTRLTLPRSNVDLTLAGGFVADRAETANESRWTLYGQPNTPMMLTWKRKVDDRRTEQPLKVRARIVELVALGEDSCQVSADVRVEVQQGLAREVTLAIPARFVVNQVNGSTVADWEVSNGALRVTLLEPTAAEASFVVQGDAQTSRDGAVAVPLIRMPSAERETGGVAVDVSGAGEIASQQARGLERADPSELGGTVATRESPSMIAFRHRPSSSPTSRRRGIARSRPRTDGCSSRDVTQSATTSAAS